MHKRRATPIGASRCRLVLAIPALLGMIRGPLAAAELAGTDPNTFLRRGLPTFVIGTAGDDRSDREIRLQAELVRDLLFRGAAIVADSSVEVERGPDAWPPNPILLGGPQANSVLASLEPSLPFRLGRATLVLGSREFSGEDYRLIAVVPPRKADRQGPGYPEFLLYAATGSPGIAEINAVRHGAEPILVADSFGRLLAGGWRADGGQMVPDFPLAASRRIAWRVVARDLRSPDGKATIAVRVAFPAMLPAAGDEGLVIASCLRGLARSQQKLALAGSVAMTVYVYPDRRSKLALTGDGGDGHAVPATRAVHVVRFDPSEGGPLESLVAHEGTHVLTLEFWGPAGTPLLGEGVAVWAAGQYGGIRLSDWARRSAAPAPSVAELLGGRFRQLPEERSYPLAGLFIEAVAGRVGVDALRDHLYGATATTWNDACRRASATPQELGALLQNR